METKRKPYKLKYGHKLRRVFTSLDEGSIAKAKELGNGNLSKGVRAALSLVQVGDVAPLQDSSLHDTDPAQSVPVPPPPDSGHQTQGH